MISKLKSYRIAEKENDAKWDMVLKSFKKKKKKNKKTAEEIEKTLNIPKDLEDYIIRGKKEWSPKSFNLRRQQESYINHLFVKYKVPICFYKMFIKSTIKCNRSRIDDGVKETWFIAIAQGWSFRKESKAYFNKKEAHLFCNGIYENFSENFWYAKCTYIGINTSLFKWLYDKHLSRISVYNLHYKSSSKFYKNFLLFFSKFQEYLDKITTEDILDYISAMRRENSSYSLKGRTITSIIEQSNRWHRDIHKQSITKKYKWDGIEAEKFSLKKDNINWKITQLLTSKELYKEGKALGHCVHSYAIECSAGHSAIFSLRSTTKNEIVELEKVHVTIEIKRGMIVQKRGKFNREPTKEENNIIRLWAIKNNFKNWS